MQVILLERIGKLGQMGDTVTVKDGYARNYLLPQGKALRATEANRQRFDEQRAQLETRNLELRKEADSVAEKLNGQVFVVIRQSSDTGHLYGSASSRDIADIVTQAGYSIARHQVQLDKTIKTLGLHPVRIALHPEVVVSVTVNVARSEEEAKRQARGEDVTAHEEEKEVEVAIAAEEIFEDEEQAHQVEEELEADVAEVSAQESEDGGGDSADDADDTGDTGDTGDAAAKDETAKEKSGNKD